MDKQAPSCNGATHSWVAPKEVVGGFYEELPGVTTGPGELVERVTVCEHCATVRTEVEDYLQYKVVFTPGWKNDPLVVKAGEYFASIGREVANRGESPLGLGLLARLAYEQRLRELGY
jgi:hypothetical protein